MDLSEAERLLIAALGLQSAFWGMGRTMGELYAVLYTAREPLALQEIATRLGVTKGNVSIAIRRLEDLGMVDRQHHPGDRRVYFVATTNFWDIARHFLERRYQPAFSASFRLLDQSLQQAQEDKDPFVAERIQALKSFYDVLDRLTALLLETNPDTLAQLAPLLSSGEDIPKSQYRGKSDNATRQSRREDTK